jgi:GYF domain 2
MNAVTHPRHSYPTPPSQRRAAAAAVRTQQPVADEGEVFHVIMGPNDTRQLSLEQIDDFFRLGVIDEQTLIWSEGMAGWETLGAAAGLGSSPEAATRAAPPPRRAAQAPAQVPPASGRVPQTFSTSAPLHAVPAGPAYPVSQVRDLAPPSAPPPPAQGPSASPRAVPSHLTTQQSPQSYPAPSQRAQPAQSYPAQSYPAQSQPAQSYPPQSHPVQSQRAPSHSAQSYPAQSYPAQSYPAQSQPAQSYPAQSQPAQSYPAQSYPAQSQPAQSPASQPPASARLVVPMPAPPPYSGVAPILPMGASVPPLGAPLMAGPPSMPTAAPPMSRHPTTPPRSRAVGNPWPGAVAATGMPFAVDPSPALPGMQTIPSPAASPFAVSSLAPDISWAPPRRKARWQGWLMGLCLAGGGFVVSYRNDYLLQAARSMQQEKTYLALERQWFGGVPQGTPRQVQQMVMPLFPGVPVEGSPASQAPASSSAGDAPLVSERERLNEAAEPRPVESPTVAKEATDQTLPANIAPGQVKAFATIERAPAQPVKAVAAVHARAAVAQPTAKQSKPATKVLEAPEGQPKDFLHQSMRQSVLGGSKTSKAPKKKKSSEYDPLNGDI